MVLDPGIAAGVKVDRWLRLPENETLDQPWENFFKSAGSCLRGTIRPSGNLADQYMKQGVFGFPSFSGGDGGQGLGGAAEASGAKSAPLGLSAKNKFCSLFASEKSVRPVDHGP